MNWILLRGLGRDQRHWLDFPKLLTKPGDSVHCLDMPGFGTEEKATSPMSIRAITDNLRSRWLQLNLLGQKNALIGISLGGMTALDWSARFSDDFHFTTVINSSSKDLSSLIQRLSLYAYYRILRSRTADNLRGKELQILKMISNLKANDPEVLSALLRIAEGSNPNPLNLPRQLFAATQFICPSKISTPVLVLASIKDRMVDVRCSKAIAEKLSAPIKFHPTAGHDLTLDDPEWVAERIHEFVGVG